MDSIAPALYEWTGAAWSLLVSAPPWTLARFNLGYDELHGQVVAVTNDSNKTYTFYGGAWHLAATSGPGADLGSGIAWDWRVNQLRYLDQSGNLWAWNGSTWAQIASTFIDGNGLTDSYLPRWGANMVWDGIQLLVFGGNTPVGGTDADNSIHQSYRDTWTIDAAGNFAFVQALDPLPPERGFYPFVQGNAMFAEGVSGGVMSGVALGPAVSLAASPPRQAYRAGRAMPSGPVNRTATPAHLDVPFGQTFQAAEVGATGRRRSRSLAWTTPPVVPTGTVFLVSGQGDKPSMIIDYNSDFGTGATTVHFPANTTFRYDL
jgi:hypothetical protein